MSLVHEALEKAKRESASRTAKQMGLPDQLAATAQPFRARRRLRPRPLAFGVGLVAVALTAATTFWLARPADRVRLEPAAAVPVPAPPPLIESTLTTAVAVPAALPAPPQPAAATARPAAPPSTAAAAEKSAFAPAFVRQVTLETGVVVRLGGIAWSEAAPLAYLNGKLLAAGESVEGLRVERIERDRVVLAGGGVRLTITLR